MGERRPPTKKAPAGAGGDRRDSSGDGTGKYLTQGSGAPRGNNCAFGFGLYAKVYMRQSMTTTATAGSEGGFGVKVELRANCQIGPHGRFKGADKDGPVSSYLPARACFAAVGPAAAALVSAGWPDDRFRVREPMPASCCLGVGCACHKIAAALSLISIVVSGGYDRRP